MLMRLLKEIFRGASPREAALEQLAAQVAAHRRAPVERHVDILFGATRVEGKPFLPLLAEALKRAGSATPPEKAIRRPASVLYLIEYFRYARKLGGAWAECGVYTGVSAAALCLAARAENPAFDGAGLHLVDSFEGLSERSEEDRAPGAVAVKGNFAASMHTARTALADFPAVAFHKGWIPEVLNELPEQRWAFVHVDVDLYKPTLAALEYFEPRLVRGGIIVCDDYGAPTFPGARRAWDAYCGRRNLPFVVLPTGQAVLLNP